MAALRARARPAGPPGIVTGSSPLRVVRYVSGGFADRHVRAIARDAGIDLRPGWPRAGEAVAAWGHAATSRRAEAVAARSGAEVVRFEDAWLRGLHPGRREPVAGLLIDRRCHFDSRGPSDIEDILATHPFDDGALIGEARATLDAFRRAGSTKYAAADAQAPPPGYVLVIDQTRGDASIRLGGATAGTFREMLATARAEHPGARIVVKAHPAGAGHLTGPEAAQGAEVVTARVAPAALLEGAVAVYAVSSQMGLEAVLHGHRPVLFGQPFYAGWGLTDDRRPVDRRTRALTRVQLVAGAFVLYPLWRDPFRGGPCSALDAIRAQEAAARAWREDRAGWSAPGMRLWKRPHVRRFLSGRVTFRADARRRPLVWGAEPGPDGATRMEDGVLRSRGLGAELTPPLSLVLDGSGIYYDPTRPSDLEGHVRAAATLPQDALARARALREAIVAGGLTKYNLDARARSALPRGCVLVPGQVADDASMRLGAPGVDDAAMLRAARAAHPDAVIVFKPHPDVEAGLRPGALDPPGADHVARATSADALLARAARVWTATSTLGFEALLRGIPVSCLGMPFYAGWGLTEDHAPVPERRRGVRPSLDALVHAVLVAYPRYVDPVTRRACPPEVAVDRLLRGPLRPPGPANRTLSKLQGLFASTPFWR